MGHGRSASDAASSQRLPHNLILNAKSFGGTGARLGSAIRDRRAPDDHRGSGIVVVDEEFAQSTMSAPSPD